MRIGILISGRGSNMVALADAVRSGVIPDSEVAIVISDKAGAPGLGKARDLGLETAVIARRGRSRVEHDREIIDILKQKDVELVCLAGYMRLVSAEFVASFRRRILNVHPSLLPAFPGLDAQRQAVEYGVKISGCTVHLVDEELDHGAIVAQRAVEVRDRESAEEFASRLIETEHSLYVDAVRQFVCGDLEFDGDRRVFRKVL